MSLPETPTRVVLFLSTLSLRRATFLFADHIELRAISIHALLAESDQPATKQAQNLLNFYPRSPCGERRTKTAPALRGLYFYPRSPCGERPAEGERVSYTYAISIHALLAESDLGSKARQAMQAISIHALLAESDSMGLDGRFKL